MFEIRRDWLKELRETHGITVFELAHQVGITPQALWFFETGQRTPGLRVGLAIADTLGFDPHRFLDNEQAS